jgi:hypothetical protein
VADIGLSGLPEVVGCAFAAKDGTNLKLLKNRTVHEKLNGINNYPLAK